MESWGRRKGGDKFDKDRIEGEGLREVWIRCLEIVSKGEHLLENVT